jgi:hypothetical protein
VTTRGGMARPVPVMIAFGFMGTAFSGAIIVKAPEQSKAPGHRDALQRVFHPARREDVRAPRPLGGAPDIPESGLDRDLRAAAPDDIKSLPAGAAGARIEI